MPTWGQCQAVDIHWIKQALLVIRLRLRLLIIKTFSNSPFFYTNWRGVNRNFFKDKMSKRSVYLATETILYFTPKINNERKNCSHFVFDRRRIKNDNNQRWRPKLDFKWTLSTSPTSFTITNLFFIINQASLRTFLGNSPYFAKISKYLLRRWSRVGNKCLILSLHRLCNHAPIGWLWFRRYGYRRCFDDVLKHCRIIFVNT